jgi:hypothetical protein
MKACLLAALGKDAFRVTCISLANGSRAGSARRHRPRIADPHAAFPSVPSRGGELELALDAQEHDVQYVLSQPA